MRAGQPAQRRPGHLRAGAGGRALGLPHRPVHPHAGRAAVPDRQPALRLEVRDRAGAGDVRPPDLPRPRQGARRLELDQRDDLPARQPDGLRALGGRRRPGVVGLPALPALLQAHGDRPGRRPAPGRHLARRQRAARAGARTRDQPAVRGVLRGRAAGGLPAHRRRQRLPPGGLRAVRPQRAPWSPPLRRPRLPAPGDGPAQPPRRDARPGHPDPLRRQAGHRRRLPARLALPPAGQRRRGAALRRRDQHPAADAALGRGQPRSPPAARRTHGPRAARGRREPPGPPRGLHPVRLQAAGLDRPRPGVAPASGHRLQLAVPPHAGSAPPTTSRAAASSAATTTWTGPT